MIDLSKLLFTPLSSIVSYIFLRESYDPSPKKKKKKEKVMIYLWELSTYLYS